MVEMIVVASSPAVLVPLYREPHPLDCPWCGGRQPVQAQGACNECGEVYLMDFSSRTLVTHPESHRLPFNMRSLVLAANQFRWGWSSFRAYRK